jgi:hypothetical protein
LARGGGGFGARRAGWTEGAADPAFFRAEALATSREPQGRVSGGLRVCSLARLLETRFSCFLYYIAKENNMKELLELF